MRKIVFKSLLAAVAILVAVPAIAQEVELRVLCIGNSFTFFYDSDKRLSEIAASQGHNIYVEPCTVGGYTFHRHIIRDETMSKLTYNRYDRVFLQDQSQTPAVYAQDPTRAYLIGEDAKELADRVWTYSPDAKIWIEQTWSYPSGNCGGFGTLEKFDDLLREGTRLMAEKAGTEVSPIGEAFIISRLERPDINLYDPDNKHQSLMGTYLKSCVNYLILFGEAFHGTVDNCGVDPEKAAYLQKVAERVVLGNERINK